MKRTKTERFFDKLCVDLGFCLPPEEIARLSASPPQTVKAFTDAVFINTNDGSNGPLYRIYHDAVHESGYDPNNAIAVVLKNYETLLRHANP